MMLSSLSTTSMEDVAEASGHGLRWMQLYVYRNREITKSIIQRAEKAGYKAIVVTADTPVIGKRLVDTRDHFNLPPNLHLANFSSTSAAYSLSGGREAEGSFLQKYSTELLDPSLTWEGIDWIRSMTQLPVLVKGILTAEDAVEAVKHGVQGIIVSNHGGRQLDGVLATVSRSSFLPSFHLSLPLSVQIDALSEVVSAVEGRVEVYMDGGVRQGTDVLKALALGARAVFIGRPILWGLTYNGQEGVERVLEILRDELKTAMMLSGKNANLCYC